MLTVRAKAFPVPPIVILIGIAVVVMAVLAVWQAFQPHFPLDLNTASVTHLKQLPGVDEAWRKRSSRGAHTSARTSWIIGKSSNTHTTSRLMARSIDHKYRRGWLRKHPL